MNDVLEAQLAKAARPLLLEERRPQNKYRAVRGKPPWGVGHPWVWEIEKVVNPVTGRGINVAAWIGNRMRLEMGEPPLWRVMRKSSKPRRGNDRWLGGDT